jgi:hypothetical protein
VIHWITGHWDLAQNGAGSPCGLRDHSRPTRNIRAKLAALRVMTISILRNWNQRPVGGSAPWRRCGKRCVVAGLLTHIAACSAPPSTIYLERPQTRTRLSSSSGHCAEHRIEIEGLAGERVSVGVGERRAVRVPDNSIHWWCGEHAMQRSAPATTNMVELSRGLSEHFVWTFYQE